MESGPRRYHSRELVYATCTRWNRLIFRFWTIRMDSNWMQVFIVIILYIYIMVTDIVTRIRRNG